MKKLKVAVDSLKVDTFVVDSPEKEGGTVVGLMTAGGGACCTREGTGCHTVNFTTPCNNC